MAWREPPVRSTNSIPTQCYIIPKVFRSNGKKRSWSLLHLHEIFLQLYDFRSVHSFYRDGLLIPNFPRWFRTTTEDHLKDHLRELDVTAGRKNANLTCSMSYYNCRKPGCKKCYRVVRLFDLPSDSIQSEYCIEEEESVSHDGILAHLTLSFSNRNSSHMRSKVSGWSQIHKEGVWTPGIIVSCCEFVFRADSNH